jgi:HPt (histidine-containing phosphotransfer) domain-containing protein
MAYEPAMTRDAPERDPSCSGDTPAFDEVGFDELAEAIGDDGVMEMAAIFSRETRKRLQRLRAGNQSNATLLREMHTLKGAAGSVAAPRLTDLGNRLEQVAHLGEAPTPHDLDAVAAGLEAWLAAVRAWAQRHVATSIMAACPLL